jgi:RHS repeat-associated protein
LGQRIYKTNGSVDGQETGLGIVLKVMAGDKIKISGESYYNLPAGDPGSPVNLAVMDLLSALIGSPGMPAGKGLTGSDINSIGNNGGDILSAISVNPPSNTAKASISYLVFDEQFKNIDGGRDWVASGSGALYTLHTQFINNPITITKSGYIYIYVSNQSNLNVYFDNLSVTHTQGPILETTDYYPFGLTMAGISSKALSGAVENKRKFNDGTELDNKEFGDGSGLELYSTDFRSYDHQIGRFHQQDPIGEYFEDKATYAFANNNPILLNDPLGLAPNDWIKKLDGTVIFDATVTNQKGAEKKYGKGAEDLGKETELYDVKAGKHVHGNADGTTSESKNEILSEVTVTAKSSRSKSFNIHDAEEGLKVVNENFGKEMARNVERMYRMETSHFTSAQYRHTGTGGMEVHGPPPYYGWTPSYFTQPPVGVYSIFENKGLSGVGGNAQVTNRPKQFVIMPSVVAAMMFKANYIQGHDGNYARWFSTNPQTQEIYRKKIQAITPKIVNGF